MKDIWINGRREMILSRRKKQLSNQVPRFRRKLSGGRQTELKVISL